jgi:two-component system, cell cycle sensor histidine kinase and response regulator CckA
MQLALPFPDDDERKQTMTEEDQAQHAESVPSGSALEFRRLLEKLPVAAYTCDRDGLITYFNQRAVQLWGREPKVNDPADRFCGSFRLFAPDGSPLNHDQCWMARTLRDNKEYNGLEIVIERPDGSRQTALAHANPFCDESNQLAGVVNVLVDITDRERLQEQLRQAQKMEAVGRLAGGVAHELNNILHVIQGYSSMLLAAVPKEQPMYAALCAIKNEGERAARLTEQLLAFGRRQMLAPVQLDLNELVADVEKVLRQLLGASIYLFTRLHRGALPIEVDPNQLKEALVNLALNARDAMPDGGELTIQTANADPDDQALRTHPEARPIGYVVLTVRDTGVGMDEETQKRCLEPFFTTKAIGKGIGLGLSTVDGIVHQSGGFITLSSAAGKGTAFTIYLPAVAPEPHP